MDLSRAMDTIDPGGITQAMTAKRVRVRPWCIAGGRSGIEPEGRARVAARWAASRVEDARDHAVCIARRDFLNAPCSSASITRDQ